MAAIPMLVVATVLAVSLKPIPAWQPAGSFEKVAKQAPAGGVMTLAMTNNPMRDQFKVFSHFFPQMEENLFEPHGVSLLVFPENHAPLESLLGAMKLQPTAAESAPCSRPAPLNLNAAMESDQYTCKFETAKGTTIFVQRMPTEIPEAIASNAEFGKKCCKDHGVNADGTPHVFWGIPYVYWNQFYVHTMFLSPTLKQFKYWCAHLDEERREVET